MSNFISTTPTLNLPFNRQKTPEDMNSLLKRVGATYTRGGDSGSATYVNSKGLIEVVPDGLPRPDFDPVTKQNKGLLIEEGRTNYFLNSYFGTGDLTSWTTQNIGAGDTLEVVADDEAFGGNALRIVSIDDRPGLYQGIGSSLKPDTMISLRIKTVSTSQNEGRVKVRYGSSASYVLTLPDDGEWHVVDQYISGTGGNNNLIVEANEDGEFLVDWVQAEKGSFPTSYIPTAGSSVTRGADKCYIDGTDFTDFYNQNEGTILAEFSKFGGLSEGGTALVAISDGTNNERLYLSDNSAGGNMGFFIVTGGNLESRTIHSQPIENEQYKLIGSYSLSEFKSVLNAGTKETDDPPSSLSVVDKLNIGNDPVGSKWLNGHLERLLYFPVSLSDLEQIKLTRNL